MTPDNEQTAWLPSARNVPSDDWSNETHLISSLDGHKLGLLRTARCFLLILAVAV
jgi:hypothetical protein